MTSCHRQNVTIGNPSQRQLNPKYSLLVKDKLDKLLDIGFIYLVSLSEWMSPIVIAPKKKGSSAFVKTFEY